MPLLTETSEKYTDFGTAYQKENVPGIIACYASIEPSFFPHTILQTSTNTVVRRHCTLMKAVNPRTMLLMTDANDEVATGDEV
jgi:hypothetical protein